MKRAFLLVIALSASAVASYAQYITVDQYVKLHESLAVREMKRMGVPAAITLAQGILETENGNSDLVKKSNNHFGIKCKSSWNAAGVNHDDDAQGECFRSYKDAEGSYRDHSNYLRGNDRYAFLFRLDPRDYKGWAYGLKRAGYATNPRYPEILIKNIEQNNLQQFTLLAINDVPVYDASKYKADPEEKAIEEITAGSNGNNLNGGTNFHKPYNAVNSPEGMVNGCKMIFAEKGKSLLAIATEHDINLARLLEYNDLEKDGLLDKDQSIFLEKKQKEGPDDYYVVQANETLYDVAQKNGVRLQNLMEYNQVSNGEPLSAGRRVFLKPGIVPPALYENPVVSTTSPKFHTVQPKEGLYTISKKYGISVAQMKEWNNLADDHLKVGQQLIISK
ncbi:MAG: glucosaminidase domain-containing protein [Ginsengibacter sp.]